MHDDSHIAESLRNARPDIPPPVEFDVDRIMKDGRRLRRRNRLAVGGTSAAGVVAAVGAIALLLTMSPQNATPGPSNPTAADVGIEDPAMAGYPWTEAWNSGSPHGLEADLDEAAVAAFGELLVEGGVWDEVPEGAPECDPINEGMFTSGCGDDVLHFRAEQRPGNYGQVFLRQYNAEVWGVQSMNGRPVVNLDVYLPGGWTAEPGPVTEQVFPQHLISDDAYYTDEAPAFESETLDDGRTVATADHGCAYDVLVTYPSGTALRLSWEIGCEPGTDGRYPVELESLVDAALTMPEIDYDASELQPVDELWDIPDGWPRDPSWESDGAADAAAAAAEVRAVLDARYPGAAVKSVIPTENGINYRGATFLHAYRFDGTLPVDGQETPLSYEMRYFLPGGWVPGSGTGANGEPYLLVCRADEGSECGEFERDGRTVVTKEEADGTYEVVVFHPDGWAASVWIGSAAGAGLTLDETVDLMLALPAPPYDAEAVPEAPAE